jgi:predicted nuclease of predicted toxin-antitoxin system
MRFLANENFPLAAIEALRRAGHDTAWIQVDAPGSSDEAVLARAVRDERVLLTFDKDFGALVFLRGAAASRGVASSLRRVGVGGMA